MVNYETDDIRQEIVVVWFKRDLRFIDHAPLLHAQKENLPQLFVYCFEPSIMNYADSDCRHWRFVHESLQDLQKQLLKLNTQIAIFHQEAEYVFENLHATYTIKSVFSHEEVGNNFTYQRDKRVKQFFKNNQITWHEFQHNGVVRKLTSRKNWPALWKQKMQSAPELVDFKNTTFLNLDPLFYESIKGPMLPSTITTHYPSFQHGGEGYAWKYLESFLKIIRLTLV